MNARSANNRKQWYCIELLDEDEDVHTILSTYTDEATATDMLMESSRRLPGRVHIYYWLAGKRPVAPPPEGYTEGPMARPDGSRLD